MIELRKALLKDIPSMQSLVVSKVSDGTILLRSDDEVATNIRSYMVALDEDKIIGYMALHIHSPRLGEIRSLIVKEEYRGKKIGKKLVKSAISEANDLGLEEVLVLTYLPDFFKKLLFNEIDKSDIPEHKIWADCIKCLHFPICDEISLVYKV
ncbi:N-acetylglutamate synthase [hydrothermal vent metagenome]|uniref:N-acetylglutamate synthase n=1 Tax=hydrothermal vent metagenome TaxID=652676 RepID=A0A1W1EJK1_9ZZZZ